jgi:hypothetical protein
VDGAHRSTTQNPVISARKSAVWLLALITMLLASLGLLGFVIYFPIAHPKDLQSLTIAVQSASWVALFAHLTLVLVRNRPHSPAQLAHVISEACLLACSGGTRQDRNRGPAPPGTPGARAARQCPRRWWP